jgi:hypothetical protein
LISYSFFRKSSHFRLLLKPLGFVLATGLHPLLLKTAAHDFKCLCENSCWNITEPLEERSLLT